MVRDVYDGEQCWSRNSIHYPTVEVHLDKTVRNETRSKGKTYVHELIDIRYNVHVLVY